MDTADRARELALLGIETRATQSQNTGNTGGGGTLHEPKGSPKGGQFTANPGSGGYKSILPPESGYKSGGGGKKKSSAAAVPAGVPQAPVEPRTMKAGDSGEDVRYAQYAMNLLGFKVAQDGNYGPDTEAAVKQIQARLGVKKPNGHLSAAQLHKLQDAVRLSPCIGAGQRDLESEAQWEARFAEPETDEDLDEDELAEAVTDALDEFVARSFWGDWEERAHDVSGELRIPGGVGGGRWTKSPVTAAILKALKEAKGPDPFQLDGKPIEREPLRKAAVARGITLKRGATREDIVKALLADASKGEGKPVGEKAAPSAPSPRADAKATGDAALKATAVNPTGDQLAAVDRMGGDGAYVVNDDLRAVNGDVAKLQPKNRATVGHLDALMADSPLSQSIVVHRKLGNRNPFDTSTGPEVDPLNRDLNGFTWTEPGYSSTDVTGENLKNRGISLQISVPAGTPAISHEHLDNGEILLPRGLTFKVTADHGGLPRRLDVEVVPKSNARADAKARYAAVAQSRPYASAAAAIAELTGKKQSNAVIAEHVRAIAHPDSPDMAEAGASPERIRQVEVENKIRAAFREAVAAGDRGYNGTPVRPESDSPGVRLSALRERIGKDVSKAEVDDALRRLSRQDGVFVGPDENQKTLTTADREAGVHIGGERQTMLTMHGNAAQPRPVPAASTAAHDLEQVAAAFEAGNPALGKRRMTAALKKQGITQGPVGTVPFDPATHEHLGDVPTAGTPVAVVRPGMSLHRGEGDHVQLSKAVVMSAPGKAPAKAAKPAPKAGRPASADHLGGVLDALEKDLRAAPEGRRKGALGGMSPADQVKVYRERLASGELKPEQVGGLLQRLLFQNSDAGGPVDPHTANLLKSVGEKVQLKDPRLAEAIHKAIDDAKGAPSNPAVILASLPADLTPAQRRARLRSRGVSKEEIDALVPLKSAKAPRTPLGPGGADDLAEEFYRHPNYTEQQIHDRLAGLNLAELKKVATATNVGLPRDLIKTEAGPVFQPLRKISADDLRKWIAAKIAGDRKLLANEDKFGARSENLDAEDLIRSEADDLEDDDEDYDDEPSPMELEAMAGRARVLDLLGVTRAADVEPTWAQILAMAAMDERALGHDVTPGHDQLHHYWVYGKGRALWETWRELYAHIVKYVGPLKAKVFTSRWFIERHGYAAGSDINRVRHGKPPRGHRIGPG